MIEAKHSMFFIWVILGIMLGLPAAVEAQTATTTIVPDLIGLSRTKAQSEIMAAGLVIGKVTEASSAKVLTGNIIGQSPTAGMSVALGTAVTLVISTGPAMFRVPHLVGLSQANAQTEITVAQMIVGTVTPTNSTTVPMGIVISQNPEAGTTVTQGSAVNLIVSTGPP